MRCSRWRLEPSFPEAEVELARRHTLSSLQSDLDEPGTVAARGLVQLGYGEAHPYGHPLAGRLADVAGFTRDDVVRFHAAHARAPGALLSLCGDASRDQLLELAQQRLGAARFAKLIDSKSALPNSVAPHAISPEDYLIAPRTGLSALVIHKPDSTQAQLRIVSPGLSRRAPGWAAAFVANSASAAVHLGAGRRHPCRARALLQRLVAALDEPARRALDLLLVHQERDAARAHRRGALQDARLRGERAFAGGAGEGAALSRRALPLQLARPRGAGRAGLRRAPRRDRLRGDRDLPQPITAVTAAQAKAAAAALSPRAMAPGW